MRKNLGPEKISTRWPAHCHVTYHVHVAELKETAQVPPLLFTVEPKLFYYLSLIAIKVIVFRVRITPLDIGGG